MNSRFFDRRVIVTGIIALLVGGTAGFLFGVFTTHTARDVFKGMFTSEKVADVASTKKIEQQHFQLSYPGNWKINDDEDYDPDFMLSIDSPGSSFCMFIFFGVSTEPEENIAAQREEFSKLIRNATETSFERWSTYTGKGIELKGRLFGMKGGVRIFSHSGENNSFVVVQEYFDEDLNNVRPGFDLIEKTFNFKDVTPSK